MFFFMASFMLSRSTNIKDFRFWFNTGGGRVQDEKLSTWFVQRLLRDFFKKLEMKKIQTICLLHPATFDTSHLTQHLVLYTF